MINDGMKRYGIYLVLGMFAVSLLLQGTRNQS